jgi:hypothetical protein
VDPSGIEQGARTGLSDHGNKALGSINGRTFLDQLSDYKFLKNGSAPQSYLLLFL